MRDLALDSLAAYRLTRLVRQDTITEPARDWIDERSGEQPWTFVSDALECPWCASVWCAIFVVLLRWVPGGRLLRNVLAVAALAGVADYVDDHLTGVVYDVEHDEPVGTAQTED